MLGHYILEGERVVKVSFERWCVWFEEASKDGAKGRRVGEWLDAEDFSVSTVFLVLDRSFGSGGTPVLFETMAVSAKWKDEGMLDQFSMRSCTNEEAETTHNAVCAVVKAGKHTDDYREHLLKEANELETLLGF